MSDHLAISLFGVRLRKVETVEDFLEMCRCDTIEAADRD